MGNIFFAKCMGPSPKATFKFPIFWPTAPPLPTRPPLTLTPRTRTREPITQGSSYWDDIDLRSSTPGTIDGSGNCVCNPGLGSSVPPSTPSVLVESPPPVIIIAPPSGQDVSSTISPDLTSTFPPRGYPPIEISGLGSPDGSGEESGEYSAIPEASGEASGAPEASGDFSGTPEASGESSGIPEASGESSGVTDLPGGSITPLVPNGISVPTNAGLQQIVTDAIQVLNNMGASNALSFIQFIASSISFDTDTLNQLAPSLTVLRTSLAQYPADCRRSTAATYDYNTLDDVFNFDTSFWLAPQNAVSRFIRIFETAAQFVQDYCN
ncbi:unnamed protein product [Cylicocyclus nassatus]|uniref:Uncharacterized protein n=1 Tax=Cylicocyclus nassatus TaxID=53992 RepID=A0AA36M785_CYLNA|nr:unnamed protein product [Cylicocyclus nassatus]